MTLLHNVIEAGFSIGLFANAILFLPQIIRLVRVKNAKSLSLLTFGGFSLIQLFVVLHGFIMKDYLLTIGYFISLVMCGTLTGLIVFYRIKPNVTTDQLLNRQEKYVCK